MDSTNQEPITTLSSTKNSESSETKDSIISQITREDIMNRMAFWPEIIPLIGQLKYSPFGSTSLDVPTFHTNHIKNLADTASVSDYQYASIQGRPDLLESIVKNFPETKRFNDAGINLTVKNVHCTSGAVSGFGSCIEAFCKADEEVILFEPIYPFHAGKVYLRNLTLKTVRLVYNPKINQFELDFEALKKILTPKSRLMIITNPNNPTCKVFSKEEYKKISEIIKDYPNLIVVEDAAYFLYYDEAFKPIPYAVVNPEDFKRAITFYSNGKMYNITGVRLGISFGPEDLLKKTLRYLYDGRNFPAFL